MKNYFCSLFVICLSLNAYSQNSANDVNFIRIITNLKGIVYKEAISKHQLEIIKECLTADTIVDGGNQFRKNKLTPLNSLILTPAERSFVVSALDSMINHKWKDGLLSGGAVINRQNHLAANEKMTRKPSISYRIYEFSKPLFLRSNTMCIFYSGYSCGSECGRGKLTIYVKQYGKWIKRFDPYWWVS